MKLQIGMYVRTLNGIGCIQSIDTNRNKLVLEYPHYQKAVINYENVIEYLLPTKYPELYL